MVLPGCGTIGPRASDELEELCRDAAKLRSYVVAPPSTREGVATRELIRTERGKRAVFQLYFQLLEDVDRRLCERLRDAVEEIDLCEWATFWVDDSCCVWVEERDVRIGCGPPQPWYRGSVASSLCGSPRSGITAECRDALVVQALLGECHVRGVSMPEYPGFEFSVVSAGARVRVPLSAYQLAQGDRGWEAGVTARDSTCGYVCFVKRADLRYPELCE